ncbi:MAG: Coenzyme A disulfide reductase [Candidatus Izimaplasma bacterium HR2]|nr:MAG: Coenzyme A disulfide reductase [Candidatus Izimaplasma bacterium HR2]
MKVVAIGGVALSMSAVSKLKRLNKNIDIVVYEKGEVLSYGACGMPYYISDEIKDSARLVARTKSQFKDLGITVHTKHEVVKVHDRVKEIEILNLETNEIIKDTYDKLIIGTGASAVVPPWKNVSLSNIFKLSVYEDSIKIKEEIDKGHIRKVTVIGAGFIGLEMVEAFLTRGLEVTLIQLDEQILSIFDAELTIPIEDHLRSKDVKLLLGEKVIGFDGYNTVSKVLTDKGEYDTDLVLVSIGVKPNTEFLKGSNINLAKNGAVEVNQFMETSVLSVYSGGDCAMIYNLALKENSYLPMGSNANKQGRVIAENISGNRFKFNGVLGTIVIKIIDMEAAMTGVNEKLAIAKNIKHKTVTITGKNHAGYYPNPQPITVKVIYDPSTFVILGAELVGYKDTALRVNVFALAIQKGMTTKELGFLDLAYAPPFAGVWDVIQVAVNQAK